MTTPYENFVNTALGKSLSADVTLPTADDIPVFTGIGRQVTGKTTAELGLALSADLGTAASADVGDFDPAGSAATALSTANSYTDSAVTKVWKDQGNYNVSGGTAWPTSANTIGAVAIKAGNLWVVTGAAVDGTTLTGGKVVSNGDTIRALVNNATNAGADWGVNEANLGYTPENQANKVTNLSVPSDTTFPSTNAVIAGLGAKQAADATLTALAGITSTAGFLVQTAADTFAQRVLTASTGIALVNAGGVAGDPIIFNTGRRRIPIAAAGSSYQLVVNTAYATLGLNNTNMILPTAPSDGDTVEICQAANAGISIAAAANNTVTSASTRYIRLRGAGASGTSVSLTLPETSLNGLDAVYQFTWNASEGAWYYHRIQESTTFDYNTFKLTTAGSLTSGITWNTSGVTAAYKVWTAPNVDIDFGNIITSHIVAGGAWVYATGMGSRVITATIGTNSFNVVALGSNLGHSVTIRHGDFLVPFNDDPMTITLVTATVACSFYDETGTTVLGTCTAGVPFSVTLSPNESWEIRAFDTSGAFSVKRSFYPLLPIANTKLRNNTTTSLGYTFAGAATSVDKVITLPDANIDFRKLSYIATTDSNVLGGTDCRIEGGTNNNVSGTGCETINCFYTTLSGTRNTAINCGESGGAFTGAGTENTFINCRSATQGSGSVQCTFQDMWNVNTFLNNITFPAGSKIQGLNYTGFSVDSSLQGSQSASTAVQCLGGGIAPWAYLNLTTGFEAGFHAIDIIGQETVAPYNAMIGRRHVTFLNNNSGGSVLTVVTEGTDVTKNGAAYTITITEVSGRLVITCNMTSSANTVLWRCRVRSTYQ